ncbi:MAG TPA: LuxR family transcriptional regulator [Pseudorhizobium sp.]|nr:LuxR family transcriptional regulator [Pseudorhizobium sp.]
MGIHLIMELLEVAGGEAKSARHLDLQFESMIDSYGFLFYRLALQPKLLREEEVTLVHRWPEEWTKIYRAKKYSTVDPVVRLLRVAEKPYRIRDAVFALRNQPRRGRLQRMIQDAAKHGMSDGYVFPVHGRTGLLGSLLVSGRPIDLSATELALFDAATRSALLRHLELRGYPLGLEKAEVAEPSLTKRELDVVRHLAEGLTSSEIARELGISSHTVDWYINGLQEKMKAKNRLHVVAIALRRGLVA